MKATIRSLICAAAVLSALVAAGPIARADETSDYINQIYQDQQDNANYMNQLQQTQDYVDQIYKDQQARDDYYKSIAPQD
jgi:outer membrane murein-binding lipoprotein Lpp